MKERCMIYPRKYLFVNKDGEQFYPISETATKLAEKYCFIKRYDKNKYLVVNDEGFISTERQKDGSFKVSESGDWFELLEIMPASVYFIPLKKLRDKDFRDECFAIITEGFDDLLESEVLDQARKNNALIKRNELIMLLCERVNQAIKFGDRNEWEIPSPIFTKDDIHGENVEFEIMDFDF